MSIRRFLSVVAGSIPTVLVFAALAATAYWGHRNGWKVPKFAELFGGKAEEETEDWCKLHNVKYSRCLSCHPELAGGSASDWCKEHGVAESKCTICHPELLTGAAAADWCREHGVPESSCNLCHPEIVVKGKAPDPEIKSKVSLAPGIKAIKDPRTCQTHNLRVQFATPDSLRKAGIRLAAVVKRPVGAFVAAGAEVEYPKDKTARLSARVSGRARKVEKLIGDTVKKGDVLAFIESTEAARTAADFQRAVADVASLKNAVETAREFSSSAVFNQLAEMQAQYLNARRAAESLVTVVEKYRRGGDSVPALDRLRAERELSEAKTAVDGLVARFEAVGFTPELLDRLVRNGKPASPADLLRDIPASAKVKLQSLGKPESLVERAQALSLRQNELVRLRRELVILGYDETEIERMAKGGTDLGDSPGSRPPADGLSAVVAPFDGVVIESDVSDGEPVDSSKTLFVVADIRRMWVMIDIRQEDIGRIAKQQAVSFRPDGNTGDAAPGEVVWIDTGADEKTRTIRVRADVDNRDGRLKAHTFGNARITVRSTSEAVVVANEAIHWEGCCWIVFVRLTDGREDEIFQARKVNLGVRNGEFTEVVAGVSAGEVVAVKGSHVLKSEILRSSLGAGCCADE